MSEPPVFPVDIFGIEDQLAELWMQQESGESTVSRTVLLTLFVICQQTETSGRVSASIAAIASDHPARAIIVTNSPAEEALEISARTSVSCQLVNRSDRMHCSEQIFIEAHGADSGKIASAIQPLALPDVPLIIWIADAAAPNDEIFERIIASSDCVLIDSCKSGDIASVFDWVLDVAESLGPIVVDLAWVEMAQKRLAVAQHFDPDKWRRLLPSITRIEVCSGTSSVEDLSARELMLAGWISSRLQWRDFVANDGAGESISVKTSDGRQLDFVHDAHAKPNIRRVRLFAEGIAVFETTFTIEQSEAVLCVQESGAELSSRTLYLKPHADHQILCGALETTRQDQIYIQSLRAAAEILAVSNTVPQHK